jgi:hypothetical protein
MAWVSIGIFVAGIVAGGIAWLIKRRISRLDALEAAVFGEAGVRNTFHKYATTAELEKRVGELKTGMQGISEEGERREERILAAIKNQTLVMGSEVREMRHDVREQMGEVKSDIRQQSQRIDDAIARSAPNSR